MRPIRCAAQKPPSSIGEPEISERSNFCLAIPRLSPRCAVLQIDLARTEREAAFVAHWLPRPIYTTVLDLCCERRPSTPSRWWIGVVSCVRQLAHDRSRRAVGAGGGEYRQSCESLRRN